MLTPCQSLCFGEHAGLVIGYFEDQDLGVLSLTSDQSEKSQNNRNFYPDINI